MRVVIAEDQVLLREGPARLFEDGGQEIMATPGDPELLLATAGIGVGRHSWALAGGGAALLAGTFGNPVGLRLCAQRSR